MLVHAPDDYARKVGLRVLVVGRDGEPGDPWPTRLAQELAELPGVVWLLPGDLARDDAKRLAWTWQALEAADLVVGRLDDPTHDGAVALVLGRALGRRPTILYAPDDHALAPCLAAWGEPAAATLVVEAPNLADAVVSWIRARLGLVRARALPESRELEERERDLREDPGEATYEAYWRQLVRMGVTEAETLAEVRPKATQGYGSSRWKVTASLQPRRLATLAPELGEPRVTAPRGELPSEEHEGDRHPDHSVILQRNVALSLEDLSAKLAIEARWDRGDWGRGGDAPEALRGVLEGFEFRAETSLVEAVADIDGWIARESRRAVVELTTALRGKL